MAERTFAVERDKLRDERGEFADSAHARDSSAVAEAVRALDKKLVENRFNVVVLGEFERGKTTFVNALLGVEMLPAVALLSIAGALVLRSHLRVGR
jgi:type IV secretory pathway ATPase VirB11/archaellum biosynthesis ATPase